MKQELVKYFLSSSCTFYEIDFKPTDRNMIKLNDVSGKPVTLFNTRKLLYKNAQTVNHFVNFLFGECNINKNVFFDYERRIIYISCGELYGYVYTILPVEFDYLMAKRLYMH